jgi:hypothetical protein
VKVIYDKETDTLSIILRRGKVAESDEPRPGLVLDYDRAGRETVAQLGTNWPPFDASKARLAPSEKVARWG